MVGWRAAQHYARVRFSPNASKYNRAIQEQPLSVLAGSDFPDFGYAADDLPLPGLTHDAGEAAHWPPFHAAAAQYIRRLPDFYHDEWSPETQKLVAFTFGTAVHYITDETWEGLTPQLGRGQGMVRTVSSLNLGHPGQTDDDEGPANMAADFGVSFLLNETGIEPWRREYPMNDIVEIYKLVPQLNPPAGTHGLNYSNVTVVALEECKVIFDLGLWAEKVFGQFLFEAEYAKQVPLMAERMLDLPIGGIDDMAVWTGWVWERIARWIDSGPPPNPMPRYINVAHEDTASPSKPTANDGKERGEEWMSRFLRLALAAEEFKDRGNVLELLKASNQHPVPPFGWRRRTNDSFAGFELVYQGVPGAECLMRATLRTLAVATRVSVPQAYLLPPRQPPAESTSVAAVATPIAASAAPLGYLGSATAVGDFDADGRDDLVVGSYGAGNPGSPQTGAVDIHYGLDPTSAALEQRKQLLPGSVVHGRFGKALAVIDWNADGVDDLAVGAPSASFDQLNATVPVDDSWQGNGFREWGRVYIFLGHRGSGLAPTAATTIETTDDLTGFGELLYGQDLDEDGHVDLQVGCPWSSFKSDSSTADKDSINTGSWLAYLSGNNRPAKLNARHDALFHIRGDGYEWLGQSAVTFVVGNQSFLAIGAPGHRNATGVTVGALHIYSSSYLQRSVDSPRGRSVQQYDAALPAPERTCTLEGASPLGEFGASVAVSASVSATADKHATVLAVGSPNEGEESTDLRGGVVRLLNLDRVGQSDGSFFEKHCQGGSIVQLEELTKTVLRATVIGPRLSRFGRIVQFVPLKGSGVPAALLIAAPLANGNDAFPIVPPPSRELGAVFGWLERDDATGGLKLPGNGKRVEATASASWHGAGTEPKGRLGSSLAVVRGVANKTSLWVVAGAPLASRQEEMAGELVTLALI